MPLEIEKASLREVKSPLKDRRRNWRVLIALDGKFLMEGGEDHSLQTLNMSCGGALFVSSQRPEPNARLICYLDDLGRIEAQAVRITDDGFAVRFDISARKRDKIADRLTWLANYKRLGLDDDRAAPRYASGGPALVQRADGRVIQCRTIDISLTGAAFEADGPAPFVGEIVTTGNIKGEVVRSTSNEFAIRYLTGPESG